MLCRARTALYNLFEKGQKYFAGHTLSFVANLSFVAIDAWKALGSLASLSP